MKESGMARNGNFILLLLALGFTAGSVLAQVPPPPSSSLMPEKMMAKEKAVEERAAKRRECKTQAKEAGLGLMARRKFVTKCMATK
jgi:hypothetical protein